jgi:hypothetical protein
MLGEEVRKRWQRMLQAEEDTESAKSGIVLRPITRRQISGSREIRAQEDSWM